MDKVLFQSALTDTDSTDKDRVGSLRFDDQYGRVYRYVRNDAATALQRNGCCLAHLVGTYADLDKGVYSPDAATGPSTAMIHVPAGVPMTNLGATGSTTGCYGWVQVEGLKRVNIKKLATAVQQAAGCWAIATTVELLGATAAWGKPQSFFVDTGDTQQIHNRRIVLASRISGVTDLATAVSASVYVRCLP